MSSGSQGRRASVTGLSGSGPAFVYTFIEALSAGGVQEGLRLDIAHALAVQTVVGAAHLVKVTGEHPALLREKVCSPAGTTISAIRVLEERGESPDELAPERASSSPTCGPGAGRTSW